MNVRISSAAIAIIAGVAAACASAPAPRAVQTAPQAQRTAETTVSLPWKSDAESFRSTYASPPSGPVVIRNATILTGTGARIDGGSVLLRDGVIAAVGQDVESPAGATVVEAAGKWVTPGIIDAHSHLGVYASPSVEGHSDGNETTDPNTAEVWAEHSVWPQDPQFPLALAGGVTTLKILPGSANLFGGRSVTVKNVPARDVYAMKFPAAPHGLKMACGENPSRLYGSRNRTPATRMGNVAGYRSAWIKADKYRRDWKEYVKKIEAGENDARRPERDLELDTLAAVLEGEILVQNHCYRADEMQTMIEIAREFGFRITAFHHATEAYKIADVLAKNDICAAIWADWWGFKMEALDGIRENAALVERAGGCAVIHSDSAQGIQRLNQEAAKAMASGNAMGMSIKEEDAIRWITAHPAKAIGIAEKTGSLEPGKMADVVVWSGNPFSVYSRAEKVYIDGVLRYDRATSLRPETDFSVGLVSTEVIR